MVNSVYSQVPTDSSLRSGLLMMLLRREFAGMLRYNLASAAGAPNTQMRRSLARLMSGIKIAIVSLADCGVTSRAIRSRRAHGVFKANWRQ